MALGSHNSRIVGCAVTIMRVIKCVMFMKCEWVDEPLGQWRCAGCRGYSDKHL